jgi:hypothetical protein
MANHPDTPADKLPKPGLNIYVSPAVNPYKLTILCEELEYILPSQSFHITLPTNIRQNPI